MQLTNATPLIFIAFVKDPPMQAISMPLML